MYVCMIHAYIYAYILIPFVIPIPCIHACMHACIHTYILMSFVIHSPYMYMYVCMHAYWILYYSLPIHTCMYVCMHAYWILYVHFLLCIHIHAYIHTLKTFMHAHIRIRTYEDTHIHTYIHTYRNPCIQSQEHHPKGASGMYSCMMQACMCGTFQ
jgi:hypothetical protein